MSIDPDQVAAEALRLVAEAEAEDLVLRVSGGADHDERTQLARNSLAFASIRPRCGAGVWCGPHHEVMWKRGRAIRR